jgi:hypothetical protein
MPAEAAEPMLERAAMKSRLLIEQPALRTGLCPFSEKVMR